MSGAGVLQGRVVVITGASRGIGEAIAGSCAAAGAAVVLAARKPEGLQQAVDAITNDGGTALAVPCHVGHPEEVEALFARAVAEFGKVDGLVNNAATNPYMGPTLAITDAAFDKIFEVNVKGCLYAAREFVARARSGAIVNIASRSGMAASPLVGAYGMSKAALISMTRTLAVELAGLGIRVNAIAPGLIETRFAAALLGNPEITQRALGALPMSRPGRPEEVAGAAVYLLSDAASYVNGATLVIDGGLTA